MSLNEQVDALSARLERAEKELTRNRAFGGGARPYVEIPIPLIGGGEARLSLPRHLTEDGWTQLHAVLAAMKPALVSAGPCVCPALCECDKGDTENE